MWSEATGCTCTHQVEEDTEIQELGICEPLIVFSQAVIRRSVRSFPVTLDNDLFVLHTRF